ncbi:hypothetical protein CKJ56_01525 [Mycobacterium intracellulare subsp. chimaera]|nr:hypothetical protein CKJ58_02170 [Mycobacterium intracellulare subsp. chimaera]PBA53603.1 hypothetical protein CKJ57_01990 [Mycobacterium intracellulare subsp. chimaera]PBA61679.1 hypothetical protein CKJ56_01525 [Mycobacterium intracellulare subsp. chimaera]
MLTRSCGVKSLGTNGLHRSLGPAPVTLSMTDTSATRWRAHPSGRAHALREFLAEPVRVRGKLIA